jgi:hypothetical protein
MLSHEFLTLQFVGYVSKLLPEAREANPGIGQEKRDYNHFLADISTNPGHPPYPGQRDTRLDSRLAI